MSPECHIHTNCPANRNISYAIIKTLATNYSNNTVNNRHNSTNDGLEHSLR